MNLRDQLTTVNPCPQAWENTDEVGRPNAEVGYIRADHNGWRWWNTVWPLHQDITTPEIAAEIDAVYDAFRQSFPTLAELRRFCAHHAERTSEPTEFNAYLEMPLCFYWLRMITRERDYNLYLYCISKAALSTETRSPK